MNRRHPGLSHVTVPDKTPSRHEYVPPAVWTNPASHAGAHEDPLARRPSTHVPKAPFAGAVSEHGLALHTAVLVVSTPDVHALRVSIGVIPVLRVRVRVRVSV